MQLCCQLSKSLSVICPRLNSLLTTGGGGGGGGGGGKQEREKLLH
jgi:hypothetical protein